jgi:hypothetical protein
MEKFKMELTWHNCKTCPPEEDFNSWLVYTNGNHIDYCAYYKKYGFPIDDSRLHEYWWADLRRTVHESPEFKERL